MNLLEKTKILISNYLEYYPGPKISVEIFFSITGEHIIILSSPGYKSSYWLNNWLPAALKWFNGEISLVEYLLNRQYQTITQEEIEALHAHRVELKQSVLPI